MPFRRALAGAVGTLLFALGVTVAAAQPPTTTTTTVGSTTTTGTSTAATTTPATTVDTTTIATTTTAPSSTAPTTTTAPTSTSVATTTTPTTTTATTAAATSTTTARPLVPASPANAFSIRRGCRLSAVALLLPDRLPLSIGKWSDTPGSIAAVHNLRYPADGSILSSGAATRTQGACNDKALKHANVTLTSISLFSGLISAKRITLELSGVATVRISGLSVDGRRVVPRRGRRVRLGTWGYLSANSGAAAARDDLTSALVIHLLAAHDGLPAGTVVLLAAATERHVTARHAARRRALKKRRAALHEPLKVTPRLALRHYIFPVAGSSDYIDTYGAFRSDVAGNWHHGDDIFADLGTPVVAVASGTINRVGWEKVGGWRLWVRDPYGDEFYYAHLSGYAPNDFRSDVVRAGEVIGFVGNTGDAFTTSPHLHFEVHPRQLLHLGYDGAVDPTHYLDRWTHLGHIRAPKPVHPRFPTPLLLEREAHYDFRELLAARHLITHAPEASDRPQIAVPAGAHGPPLPPRPTRERAVAAASPGPDKPALVSTWLALVLVAIGAAGLGGATLLLRRRR